jgi:uncharacterized protein YycO
MKKFMALAAAAALCVAGQASAKDVAAAAQLTGVSGSVMIQQGGKMVSATNASALRAGDRVVAMNGAKASVKFADGCVVQLTASNMVTIGAKSPCASGAGLVSANQAAPAALPPVQMAGYAVVAGLGIWGVVEVANNNNDSTSTSP